MNALTQKETGNEEMPPRSRERLPYTCYAGYQTCHEYRSSSSQITVEWISQPVAQHISKSLVRAQYGALTSNL